MFVLYEAQELLRIGVAHEVERPHLQAGGDAPQNVLRLVRAERLFQKFARVIHSALRHEFVRHYYFLRFLQDVELHVGGDFSEVRYLKGQKLYRRVVDVAIRL